MAALIGAGGHARDILATHEFDTQFAHHSQVGGFRGPIVIAINDPHLRAKVAEELDVNDGSWVHPNAYIGPRSTYKHGTHINYGVTMTRTKLGHHCTIAPGVTICGDVTIGDRVFIGAGAVIKNLVTIGDDAFIRMGSIVTRDVEPGERY